MEKFLKYKDVLLKTKTKIIHTVVFLTADVKTGGNKNRLKWVLERIFIGRKTTKKVLDKIKSEFSLEVKMRAIICQMYEKNIAISGKDNDAWKIREQLRKEEDQI